MKIMNAASVGTPYDDGSTPCDALVINGISTVGYSTGLVEKITGFNAINGSLWNRYWNHNIYRNGSNPGN